MKTEGIVFEGKRYWSPYGSVAPAVGLPDVSRYGNDGVFGAGALAPTYTQLPCGLWVIDFVSASNQLITVTDDNSLKPLAAYSVQIWAYFDAATNNGGIIGKGDQGAAGGGYALRQVGNIIYAYIYNGAGNRVLKGWTGIVAQTWYHVGLVVDGSNMFVFINGIQENTLACVGITQKATDLLIGRFNAETLSGQLAPPTIYSYALSHDEINKIYASERHLFGV